MFVVTATPRGRLEIRLSFAPDPDLDPFVWLDPRTEATRCVGVATLRTPHSVHQTWVRAPSRAKVMDLLTTWAAHV